MKIVCKKTDALNVQISDKERDKSLVIWKEKIRKKEKLEGPHELKTMLAVLDSRLKEINELEIKGQLTVDKIIDLI